MWVDEWSIQGVGVMYSKGALKIRKKKVNPNLFIFTCFYIPSTLRADGENRLFLLFYVQNLNGALTQSHITTVDEANECNFTLDNRSFGFLRFLTSCKPLWISSSLESNETSYHNVKPVNPSLDLI